MKRFFSVCAVVLFPLIFAAAQEPPPPPIRLLTMSPSASDASSRFPAAPPRIFTFYFEGIKGTTYTAVFGAPANPASIVGVGANISSTSYDELTRRLTVSFIFDQSVIPPEGKPFPSNVFLLAIDPGAARTYSPQPRPPGSGPPGRNPISARAAASSTECYGPLGDKTEDPARPGPPLEAAGTFMSTNLSEWCVIPPNETQPFFGFKLKAPSGKTGYFKKKMSAQLVNLLSTLSGKTLTPSDLAIFNGDVEASKSVTSTEDGGALVEIKVKFKSTSTEVRGASAASVRSGVRIAADSVTKTVTTSEEEELSLAPKDFSISGSSAALYGFVGDESSLAGSTVLIQKKVGASYKTIKTAVVGSDGSYSAKVTVGKIFGTSSSKASVASTATLIASIIKDKVTQSRTVTLRRTQSQRR